MTGEEIELTDTLTCAECGANVPEGAAFCTSCGNRLAPSPEASGAVFPGDTTTIDGAGLHDRTQVLPQAPAPGPPVSGPSDPPSAQPWSAAPPAAAPGWAPPPVAPPGAWNQPPAQPDWAQPQPAPPPQWAPPVGTAPGPWAPAPSGHRHSAQARSWTLPALLAFLGAILLVAGVFTPWFEGSDGAYPSRTGWELVSKETSELAPFTSTPDPAILLAIGVMAIVVGGLLLSGAAPALMRALLVVAGAATAGILIIDYLSIKDTVRDSFESGTEFTYQYGFWVCVVAAVVLLLAAVMPSQSRR